MIFICNRAKELCIENIINQKLQKDIKKEVDELEKMNLIEHKNDRINRLYESPENNVNKI